MILYFKNIIHIDDFPLNGHPPSFISIYIKLIIRYHKCIDFIHVYLKLLIDGFNAISPNESTSGGFEHKPLRLHFRQSRPTRDRKSMHGSYKLLTYFYDKLQKMTIRSMCKLTSVSSCVSRITCYSRVFLAV